ncbi:class I SAM-dependent methyltransferase [Pseudoblastomonas halimionae]|uniref:Methyltransferase domain-containing protein n=1 Tax=Alteriqipengyuania halimionae TaxID=1926630 RepID=A0A6I4U1I9_9SPHN|nr:class I SAM-dependent methyltransferase [Alteriqipengyuania halimionae]MXP09566.1 methyltransferase domain-containing protein [Alteriqipengyuania halimionae]
MAERQVPTIFSPARRMAARRRADPATASYVLDDMVDEVIERLAFIRHEPGNALIIGDRTGRLAQVLPGARSVDPADGFDEERPFPAGGHDFIASLGTLDTVNDLPGALVHLREALAPGGLMIASFVGAGSLERLRAIMHAADGERPAPRLHPMVDIRSGAQLLQRAGFADPVVDGHSLPVRYSSLGRLVGDLRALGLSNVLAEPGPPLGKAALTRARAKFDELSDSEGKLLERFEIITLSGRRR